MCSSYCLFLLWNIVKYWGCLRSKTKFLFVFGLSGLVFTPKAQVVRRFLRTLHPDKQSRLGLKTNYNNNIIGSSAVVHDELPCTTPCTTIQHYDEAYFMECQNLHDWPWTTTMNHYYMLYMYVVCMYVLLLHDRSWTISHGAPWRMNVIMEFFMSFFLPFVPTGHHHPPPSWTSMSSKRFVWCKTFFVIDEISWRFMVSSSSCITTPQTTHTHKKNTSPRKLCVCMVGGSYAPP